MSDRDTRRRFGFSGAAQLALVGLLATCVFSFGLAYAETERPAGLMWNRTGLPAVFPLQIKTTAGADYLVILSDAETDVDALAAYARGGDFFRVLVPPGLYDIRIHYGVGWLGEERLFGSGPETGTITLPEPLKFMVRGVGTKSGHLIDLRGMIRDGEQTAQVTPLDLCQGTETVLAMRGPTVDLGPEPDGIFDLQTLLPSERRALGPVILPFPLSAKTERLDPAERALTKLRYNSFRPAGTRSAAQPTPRSDFSLRTRPCR